MDGKLSFACGCGCSRRGFLGMALGGAAAASLGAPAFAAETGPRLIDVHHHVVPPFWFDEVKPHIMAQGGGRIVPNWLGWSPERALGEMDKTDVQTAMLTISSPGIWYGDVAAARSLGRRVNDYMAGMVAAHPKRFGLLACLPYPDTEGSLAEIDRVFGTLKADGIGLLTSYEGKYLGDPAFHPILAELNRRKATVYVHPESPLCCTTLMSYVPPFLTEFIQDTNRAVLSLLYSGALMKYPDINWIFSHAGGGIPTLTGRITELQTSVPALTAMTPHGVAYEFRRLHYEIANSANKATMDALLDVVPVSQVMFGSDFPLVPLPVTAGGLAKLDIPADVRRAIEYENARKLFPRLRA